MNQIKPIINQEISKETKKNKKHKKHQGKPRKAEESLWSWSDAPDQSGYRQCPPQFWFMELPFSRRDSRILKSSFHWNLAPIEKIGKL